MTPMHRKAIASGHAQSTLGDTPPHAGGQPWIYDIDSLGLFETSGCGVGHFFPLQALLTQQASHP